MRLSPKSVFFGLVIVGLPFAVVAGWALGSPSTFPTSLGVAGDTDGTGGLGAAPLRTTSTPGSPVSHNDGYTARPPRATVAPTTTLPATVTPAGTVTTTVTVIATVTATGTTSPPPVLTMPPVPTPTQIIDTPPVPTPTSVPLSESADPSTEPSSGESGS
ncbi:hypothetical protein [Actinoplanes sp. GCM10030250]|uniref:hypothetical protein n=1 Tax=Actinoplanes sp. GCM10030250 TaxID=3273376 RepID=UPI003615B871